MRLLERVILKCEGSVVLKAIESTECVGDSEKARLGNTTFLELTFPNSGCRGAATLWLFRSETRVNFAFWLAHPTHPFTRWVAEVVLPGQWTFLFSRSYFALHKKLKKIWGVSP